MQLIGIMIKALIKKKNRVDNHGENYNYWEENSNTGSREYSASYIEKIKGKNTRYHYLKSR